MSINEKILDTILLGDQRGWGMDVFFKQCVQYQLCSFDLVAIMDLIFFTVQIHSRGIPGSTECIAAEAGARVHQYQDGWRGPEGRALISVMDSYIAIVPRFPAARIQYSVSLCSTGLLRGGPSCDQPG